MGFTVGYCETILAGVIKQRLLELSAALSMEPKALPKELRDRMQGGYER